MMMRMFTGSRAVCLAVALVAASNTFGQAQAPAENVIHVEISGLRSDKGQVLCALFSSAEAFPKKADKAVVRLTAKIAEHQATCDFTGVAPGTYAVSVVHDENANGKLDTNFIGMPRGRVERRERPHGAAQVQCRLVSVFGRAARFEDSRQLFIAICRGGCACAYGCWRRSRRGNRTLVFLAIRRGMN